MVSVEEVTHKINTTLAYPIYPYPNSIILGSAAIIVLIFTDKTTGIYYTYAIPIFLLYLAF